MNEPLIVVPRGRRNPIPAAPLRLRIKAAQSPRRLVSDRVALRFAGRPRRVADNDLQDARATMAALIGNTPRAHEVDRLADRWIRESRALNAMFWRPWTLHPREILGRRHIEAALGSGRGVLVSVIHQGPWFAYQTVMGDRSHELYCVSAEWFLRPPGPDPEGIVSSQFWRLAVRFPTRYLDADGSFSFLADLLSRGHFVGIAFDRPGRTTTPLLGKPVDLSSGTARLSWSSRALIVPVTYDRHRERALPIVTEPLDPDAFDDHVALQRALADIHGHSILERPHATESPLHVGAWEAGATADRWAVVSWASVGRPPPRGWET